MQWGGLSQLRDICNMTGGLKHNNILHSWSFNYLPHFLNIVNMPNDYFSSDSF